MPFLTKRDTRVTLLHYIVATAFVAVAFVIAGLFTIENIFPDLVVYGTCFIFQLFYQNYFRSFGTRYLVGCLANVSASIALSAHYQHALDDNALHHQTIPLWIVFGVAALWGMCLTLLFGLLHIGITYSIQRWGDSTKTKVG